MRRVNPWVPAAVIGLTAWLAAGPTAAAGPAWTTYHADNGRTGLDSSEPGFSPIGRAWSNQLDGAAVYGQPVVDAGRVFVATEADDVYALDAHDGHVLWQANIGQPLRNVAAQVGCGDIDPLGVTSTPVVDPASSTVYVVGEVSTGGGAPVQHRLVGFDLYTGGRKLSASADPVPPAGQDLLHLQQRAALAVANGRVYVAYGGFAGDCGTYQGWVVGVDEAGARPTVQFGVTPDGTGGAIWNGGGGPSVDAAGNVYVVTGNPNSGTPALANSVVKLSPSLALEAHFQDARAVDDQDLGSGDALLLPNGQVFTAGKSQTAYFLDQATLHEVRATTGVCGSDPDGGAAYDPVNNTVYVPCRGGGIQPISVTTGAAGPLIAGANGAPIVINGQVWALQYNSGQLWQVGSPNSAISAGRSVPTFASPSAADGLILVGTDQGVVAFDGPSGPPPPAPPPPPPPSGYRLVASDGGVFAYGTATFAGSLGGVHLVAPIVGGAATPDGKGYWLVGSDGGVFAFGDAPFYGSTGRIRLAQPVVGMAVAPGGTGYWLVGRDGGVFAFGPGARFLGSTGGIRLAAPVIGMAGYAPTGGYWLVASDGGVFSFGGAPFYGSTGGVHLARPVVGAAAAPGGNGYWLVASDGGVFAFGPGARFAGSTGGVALSAPVVGMAADPATGGYWLAAADGGIFSFDAPFVGSAGGTPLVRPMVAILGP